MNKQIYNKIGIFIFCFLINVDGMAQYYEKFKDPLVQQMYRYGVKNKPSVLYVHFDKNIYTNNESLWFTAYLLTAAEDPQQHKVLLLSLIRNNDSSVIMEQKYMMENGTSFGNMVLPDSLVPGNYSLVTTSNLLMNGEPRLRFVQPITIFNNKKKESEKRLPERNNAISVKFYPEAGSLVEGSKSTIGWEVKDANGQPQAISGIVYKNEKPIDTIKTNAFGMGTFGIPINASESKNEYYVKLTKPGFESPQYSLPAIVANLPCIHIEKAVCNDEMFLDITDKNEGRYYAMVHNYALELLSFTIDMTGKPIRKLRVPLSDVPRGVNVITIMDSLGRPLAERLFFAHYDKKVGVDISTDQTNYKTRQPVKLHLKLKDPKGNPVTGYVSVACVQDNRIDTRKMMDIESYFYLKNELSGLPGKRLAMDSGKDNIANLEDILLIKGWRRYNWQDMLQSKPTDTLRSFSSMVVTGTVTKMVDRSIPLPQVTGLVTTPAEINKKLVERPIKKSAMMVVWGSEIPQMIETNANGTFEIPAEKMVMPADKKGYVIMKDDQYRDLKIKITDPYVKMSEKLAGWASREYSDASSFAMNYDSEFGYAMQNTMGNIGKNDCGDWVCVGNVLDCPIHPAGTPATMGQTYLKEHSNSATEEKIQYQGCGQINFSNVKFISGVYAKKEFYNTDYSKISANEPMYLSTIYWNYQVPISTDKDSELSFSTSDITGKFRVIVQGVSSKDVVHGEAVFNVEGKGN